jgi:hypothetical protein
MSAPPKPGYAAGNILNMLVHLGVDLTGQDFRQSFAFIASALSARL